MSETDGDPAPDVSKWLAMVEESDRPRRKKSTRMEPRSGWLSDLDFVSEGEPIPEPVRDRQVCVRLDWSQYQELQHAANVYGVRPSTMARMLVNRGTRAVMDNYRREQIEIKKMQGG